jgi:hypothetical protein
MKSTSEKLTTAGWRMMAAIFVLNLFFGAQKGSTPAVLQGFFLVGGLFLFWLSCVFHESEREAAAEQREELAKDTNDKKENK